MVSPLILSYIAPSDSVHTLRIIQDNGADISGATQYQVEVDSSGDYRWRADTAVVAGTVDVFISTSGFYYHRGQDE